MGKLNPARLYTRMDKDKVISVLKGAGIAGAGAVLTYLTQWASGADFGTAGPIIAAALSVLVNVVRKWATPTAEAK